MFYKILQFLGLKPKSDWVVVYHKVFPSPFGTITLLIDKNNKNRRKMLYSNIKEVYDPNDGEFYTLAAYQYGKDFIKTGVYRGCKLEIDDAI